MPKEEEPPKGAPLWMCTFSDMMSLLLCFFVLLFALSTIEKKKLIQASGSLRAAFGGTPGAPYLVETIPDKKTKSTLSRPAQQERKTSFAKNELRREEEHKVKSMSLQNVIQVTGTEQGITFRVSGDALFERGSAELKDGAIVALSFIASELVRFPSNPVKVEGHTDNTKNPNDPDVNWRLAADRAYAVMRFFVDWGSPEAGRVNESRFSYESYSDTKPLPEFDPDSPDPEIKKIADSELGRWMNRRVDITLVQSDQLNGTYFADDGIKNPRSPLTNPFPETEEDGG